MPDGTIFMVMHVPGPMVDLVQKCSNCGLVLGDYRNASVAIRPGHPEDAHVTGWAEGKPMLRTPDGGFSMAVSDRAVEQEKDGKLQWTVCGGQSGDA